MKTLNLILTFLFISSFVNVTKAADESLLLYFPFDEIKGEKVEDKSGNGFTGVCKGGFELVEGKFGNAISLNGTDGYVEVEHDDRLVLMGSFTIEAWLRVDGPGDWRHLIGKGIDNDTLNYLIPIDGGNVVYLAIGGWANHLTGPALKVGKWYHIAGVQDEDANKREFYVDGEVVAEGEMLNEVASDAPVIIGARIWAGHVEQFSNFTIDELAIYTRALKKGEINEHMSSGIPLAVNSHDKLTVTWGFLKKNRLATRHF